MFRKKLRRFKFDVFVCYSEDLELIPRIKSKNRSLIFCFTCQSHTIIQVRENVKS